MTASQRRFALNVSEQSGVVPGEPLPLFPGDPTPPGKYKDDDWMRFYGPDPGTDHGTTHYEVHEYCNAKLCQYRNEPCKWHPTNCECSMGACQ